MRIGEFSRLARVSVRMLRHHDQTGLLRPAHVDPVTGYRHYDPAQLETVHRLAALQELGLSLRELAPLLTARVTSEQMRDLLEEHRIAVSAGIRQEQQRLERVEARLRILEDGPLVGHALAYEVRSVPLPELRVAATRVAVPTVADMNRVCRDSLGALRRLCREGGIALTGTTCTLYHQEGYTETDIDVTLAVEVDADGFGRLSRLDGDADGIRPGQLSPLVVEGADESAAVVHTGTLPRIGEAVTALFSWIATNGRAAVGPLRETHVDVHSGPPGPSDSGTVELATAVVGSRAAAHGTG